MPPNGEGKLGLRFAVCMGTPLEEAALIQMLRFWMRTFCASMEIISWPAPEDAAPEILFWDLDSGRGRALPRMGPGSALFVCSSNPRNAISSYAHHPTGFLRKPVRLEDIKRELHRCIRLWWGNLDRIELPCGRAQVQLPLYDLIWAEGAKRGCVVHSAHEALAVREPLFILEERLPADTFLRCQRSFLVNLCHVCQIDSEGLHMSDGVVLPFGRGARGTVLEAYKSFHQYTQEGEADGDWVLP